MIQHIIDKPWIALALLLVLILLYVGVAVRLRRENKRKDRSLSDRRETSRPKRIAGKIQARTHGRCLRTA